MCSYKIRFLVYVLTGILLPTELSHGMNHKKVDDGKEDARAVGADDSGDSDECSDSDIELHIHIHAFTKKEEKKMRGTKEQRAQRKREKAEKREQWLNEGREKEQLRKEQVRQDLERAQNEQQRLYGQKNQEQEEEAQRKPKFSVVREALAQAHARFSDMRGGVVPERVAGVEGGLPPMVIDGGGNTVWYRPNGCNRFIPVDWLRLAADIEKCVNEGGNNKGEIGDEISAEAEIID